jgi:hypothetical protein
LPPSINLTFNKKPSMFATVFLALLGRRSKFDAQKYLPRITASQDGIVPDKQQLAKFNRVCQIKSSDKLPLIYPLTYIYPLVQVMLARKEAPLSLFAVLNSRMQIVQHRYIGLDEKFDVYCELTQHRIVEKGLEIDIKSTVKIGAETVWENTLTFYYRGKFGTPDSTFAPPQFDPIPGAPEVSRWFLPGNIGFSFASISGDGNPIHYLRPYARLMGFQRDFAQPLLVLAGSLERLLRDSDEKAFCLDIAFKGPIYYENNVILKSALVGGVKRFDIYEEGNPRPGICGTFKICI